MRKIINKTFLFLVLSLFMGCKESKEQIIQKQRGKPLVFEVNFKDFGNLELFDEIITQKRGSIVEEERNTYKISKGKIYTADFNDEIIYSQDLSIDDENPIANIKNREAFKEMGAKFLGNENILGYKCDIWELGEYKIWVYNSVPLKQISKSLGVEQMQIAKNANFNIDIKDNKFKLPNFPVKAIDVIIGEGEEE